MICGLRMKRSLFAFLTVCVLVFLCSDCRAEGIVVPFPEEPRVVLGDEQFDEYIPLLAGRRVALFSNRTGIVGDKLILADGAAQYGEHILDALILRGVSVTAVFCSGHDFRGAGEAGDSGSVDEKTGIPILSLQGNGSAATLNAESMARFDVLVVDVQDTGLRDDAQCIVWYRLMDVCAAHKKSVVILDRPNPNGFSVDGEIPKKSAGVLPVPAVHGMTWGELARMMNGEGWLSAGRDSCDLTVIPCMNYTHQTEYVPVLAPSPSTSGTYSLQEQGGSGKTTKVKVSVKESIEQFKKQRKPYLLYSENAPRSKWQIDARFPDWISDPNFSANNSLAFRFYHGQGSIFVTVSEECTSFSLYINASRIKTKNLKGGKTYELDISKYTKDGRNMVQVSDIQPPEARNAVRVQIPFPVVKGGSLKESGISKESFALIDKIISADIQNGFTSAQLAVIKDGRLVYQNAWGAVRTYDKQGRVSDAPDVTDETLYDLASVTKMFSVNYAVQSLVTQGMLDMDAKIIDILGADFAEKTISIDFRSRKKIPLEQIKEWKRNITVRDVITHTAGFLPSYQYFNDNYDTVSGAFNVGANKNLLFSGSDASEETRKRTLEQIFRTPLVYEPHTRLSYSDIDYMLLCFVVERVSGRRLDSFLRTTFWNPMGLFRITYRPLENGFAKDDCAATDLMGNTWGGKISFTDMRTDEIQGAVHDSTAFHSMAGISGHAGLFASADDLARLASVMLTGGYGEHSFFSGDVMDVFVSPQSVPFADYGLGWWRQGEFKTVRQFGSLCSRSAFGHQGFAGTLAFIEPEQNLVIVYLTNKINTPMVKGKELANQFEGNFYQSAVVGFVPQIVLMGLDKNVSKSQWKSLVHDMAEDARRVAVQSAGNNKDDPRWRAYNSLKNVYDSF